MSILDFLYFGEANVYQEDLDSFLVIAEEIQLKDLTRQISDEKEKTQVSEPVQRRNDISTKPKAHQQENVSPETFTAVTIPDQSSTVLQALDERVKSMMEKGQKIIAQGKQGNGTRSHTTYIMDLQNLWQGRTFPSHNKSHRG